MAEMNGGTCAVIATLSSVSTIFTLYHCFMFDRFRCLIPSRRNWHRTLMVYMLIMSCAGMAAWAISWGCFMRIPFNDIGARPVPSLLFPEKFKGIQQAFDGHPGSLNAEEALYWFHLMRSVRVPHLAKPWIGSTPFYIWIGMSVALAGLQISLPWAFYDQGALEKQLIAQAMTGGAIELSVVLSATYIVAKFPAFLRHVKASGAGPDVLSRLYFYHEANKLRTFFRYIFSIGVFVSGVDGLRARPVIGLNPFALDLLSCGLSAAFNIVLIISTVVALPRTYGPNSGAKVMVGYASQNGRRASGAQDGNVHGAGGTASQFALITLLREGGQWEGEEVVLRDVHNPEPASPYAGRGDDDAERGLKRRGSQTIRFKEQPKPTNDSRTGLMANVTAHGEWEREDNAALPPDLQHFTSHIAPHVEDRAQQGPVKIRVKVEQEVHKD